MKFKLRFPAKQIQELAGRFSDESSAVFVNEVGPAARARGFLTRPEFLALCEWKSPRTRPRCASNSEEFIAAVTGTALSTQNEQLRVEVLTLLRGVSWPTASVILHFCARDPFPILDVRALWSVSAAVPSQVDFPFWAEYTRFTRRLAARAGVGMRVLDCALWQYSKENQSA